MKLQDALIGNPKIRWRIWESNSNVNRPASEATRILPPTSANPFISKSGSPSTGNRLRPIFLNLNRSFKFIPSFLNSKLVSIISIKKRNSNFHARFSAKQRIYKYIIFNRVSRPSIEKNRGWHIRKKLDLKLMKKSAKKLLGTNDFSTFRSSSCHAKSPIRTIKSIKIKEVKNKIQIQFKSKSFLQQQVRSMVGCLKYLAEKKWDLKKFENVFQSKKRTLCAPPAPAHGLFLEKVIY